MYKTFIRSFSSTMVQQEAKLIDGKLIANGIKANIKSQIDDLKITPKLSIIQIGNQMDSTNYVKMKANAAGKLGINCQVIKLPESTTTNDLKLKLETLNDEIDCDGILVQLPIPKHINHEILEIVKNEKDVDGFGRFNLAELNKVNGQPLFKPCTPEGCLRLIKSTGIDLSGKHAVVIGRGDIVGRPMSTMLLNNDCTVTICHSKTSNLSNIVKLGDIVICAVGSPNLIKKDWIKNGAIVIDVGINYVDDSTDKRGYKIYGDCEKEVSETAGFLTPVPGGVGPMTITILMENVLLSAKRRKVESI